MAKTIEKLIAAVLVCLSLSFPVSAQTVNESDDGKVDVVLFWRQGCPHCSDEKEYLLELEEKYPEINVLMYESPKNRELFMEYAKAHNVSTQWVPVTFIGDKAIVGFNNRYFIGRDIENQIIKEINRLYNRSICIEGEPHLVSVPFLGKIDASNVSLPFLTITVGLLDGFNPCAMWVLMFLLTMLVHARSRRKMLLVGSIFVFASAFVYFLFMSAWLSVFMFIGFEDATRLVIGCVAVLAGLINLKDFLWFKKGISLSIPEDSKKELYTKMRKIVGEKNTVALIFGTLVLAFFVNFIELACTAGFPAIYTRILLMRNLNVLTYYAYLALYNIMYVAPLMLIVLAFVYTMGSRKLTEKEGRILKLVSGSMMTGLGLTLIFNPEMLLL